MQSNDHLIFATPIWGYILHGEKYHAVDYINLIHTIAETESSVKKSNFGGYQTRDNLHTEGVMQELISAIDLLVEDIAKQYNLPPLKMISMWGNINNYKDYNGAHTHEGVISGVFYLKVPENSGRLIMCNPAVRSHNSLLKSNNYPVTPSNLACILFPSWLEHYVEPNISNEERISLSFNYDLRN